jgi:hypothetical protein
MSTVNGLLLDSCQDASLWLEPELATADFGDKRLNKRASYTCRRVWRATSIFFWMNSAP